MKRLVALSAFTMTLLAAGPVALAQSPPLPALTTQQSSTVKQRLDPYRRETEARVARGEITADEADRLLRWLEWQIAQQVAGTAPANAMAYEARPPDYYAPPAYYTPPPPDYVVVEPPVRYVPYYPAPYWGPRPYYWGPAICAGGFGRHFGGRVCF